MTKRRSEMRSGLGLVQNQKVYDRPLNLCCAGKDIRRRRYVVERFADGWLGGVFISTKSGWWWWWC